MIMTAINPIEKKVTAIEKSLIILSIFSMEKPSLSLKEICDQVGFNASTTYRILHTLSEYGYIIRTADKNYCIGTTPLSLSAIYQKTNQLTQISPVVDHIRDMSNETSSFFIQQDNDRICLYRAHSRDMIRHNIDVGTQLELNRGASGRVILAYGRRLQDKAGFFKNIRDKGYYLSINEHNAALFAVSKPILSESGQLIGALTISGPISRFNEERKQFFLDLLTEQIEQVKIL
ncbi:IclR family transcriptional regulator [Candidatus Thioglobus autotrophicus]|uniref:IclR family transcriptional regulator n=1 Tax=Candidatus Thioglobus autotrophicus TaxID=1705394 RepID=UPI00299E331A|nr:IclR family transcriptional regulator [Candidatus Thioglobus autotrophicus]WPE16221.1 IclR family transcriptional regulator [Candidatus Thioglobus autotrophicus]